MHTFPNHVTGANSSIDYIGQFCSRPNFDIHHYFVGYELQHKFECAREGDKCDRLKQRKQHDTYDTDDHANKFEWS